MSDLAELEIALRQDCAYAQLADSHAHRATREDSLGLTKGRDAITALWVEEGKQSVAIEADFGDMIVYQVDGKWHGHRWIWREDGRILREVVVEDSGRIKIATPAHPPLGELNAGRGQYAADDEATLPPGFPEAARPLANRLHRAWNGRAFDLHSAEWLSSLIRTIPDAHFQFERAALQSDATALLWRVKGHDANGQRHRLIGSSVFGGVAAQIEGQTLLDWAALAAQAVRPVIDYGAGLGG